jgi:UDP-N-acetylmuramate dehydrogenase
VTPAQPAGKAKAAGAAAGARPAAKAGPSRPKFRGKVLENEPLARHTTWRIGGPARLLVQAAETEDVVSNLLVADAGFPGIVIKLGKGTDQLQMKGATAVVGAGLPTPLLARRTAEAGFAGAERFIGIPGTVGGGVYMNAGCHGAEFAEIVTDVTVIDAAGDVRTIPRRQISYKYRASNLGHVVVLETRLGLAEEDPAKLKEHQARLLRWRKAKTPFDQPCAGSTFRNPSSTRTAGMLIEEAGLKGFTVGRAQISPMHANYFVNTGGATAADVLKLIDHARRVVQKKFGVALELEVQMVGV